MERELANVVYIFTSPGMPGIKFYDRSPEGAEAKFAGTLPKGEFQTDIHSISRVAWDRNINKPNKSQLIKVREGSYTATTIIVSPEQLTKILQTIEDSKDKEHVIIDVIENKYKKDITSDLSELEQMKKELMSQTSNPNLNSNYYANESVDEIVSKNIK